MRVDRQALRRSDGRVALARDGHHPELSLPRNQDWRMYRSRMRVRLGPVRPARLPCAGQAAGKAPRRDHNPINLVVQDQGDHLGRDI